MTDTVLTLPLGGWRRRKYQKGFFRYMEKGGKRAVIRWHRRAGKDEVSLHWTCRAMLGRVGNYWHLLPEYSQARKAVWDAVNPHTGKRRIDETFPKELRKRTREAEMSIEFRNGSTWQLVGSDRYDALVGSPPVGLVFSEYALSNPLSWDYLRPMLAENGGWAIFNGTVRGRNHFWKIGEFAKTDPAWFFSEVSADQTDIFTPETLDQEQRELIAQWGKEDGASRFRQEYYNDPNVAMPGAYYAQLIAAAHADGRVGIFKYDSRYPVSTSWDLGFDSETAIWFFQLTPAGPVFIDYHHARNKGMPDYAEVLKSKGYRYGKHIAPHDIKTGDVGTGKKRFEIAMEHGIQFDLAPYIGVEDGIQATKRVIAVSRFDAENCESGLESLISYHSEFDEEKRTLRKIPVGDWASHGADSLRYMAVDTNVKEFEPKREKVGEKKSSWGF
ncbi:MAG: hypothetical protein JW395_3313 [Nitrospira sp.]|nr:hypothetical protein [Nitrospira sp.]